MEWGRNCLHFREYSKIMPPPPPPPPPPPLSGYVFGWFKNWNGIFYSQEHPLLNQRGSLCSFLPSKSMGLFVFLSTFHRTFFLSFCFNYFFFVLASVPIFSSFLTFVFGLDESCNHSIITLLKALLCNYECPLVLLMNLHFLKLPRSCTDYSHASQFPTGDRD